MLHAARLKCRTQKIAKNHHLRTIAQLCLAISLKLRHISKIGKKLVKHEYLFQISPPQYGELCPTNGWDQFGNLGTPANFNGFCFLPALLQGILVVGVSQTAALNRGRPSHWALAHILIMVCCSVCVNTIQCLVNGWQTYNAVKAGWKRK